MSYIQQIEKIKITDSDHAYAEISKKINEIIETEPNKDEVIKSLICILEKKNNIMIYQSMFAIAYTMLASCFALLCSAAVSPAERLYATLISVCTLGLASLAVIGVAELRKRTGQNRTFLINVLKFML